MASSIADQTHISDLNRVENLINTIKTLEIKFESTAPKLDPSKPRAANFEEIYIFQNNFWESHVKCIDQCNNNFMNIHEHSEINRSTCCKDIWDFCCLVNLYNQDIGYDSKLDFSTMKSLDLESRKLTILLAIEEIKKYCCKEVPNISVEPKAEKQTPQDASSDKYEIPPDCLDSRAGEITINFTNP